MWLKVSSIILRNKILLLSALVAITIFMGYHATKVEMSYEYASLLPKEDPAFEDYQQFVKTFGEEGNIITIGLTDSTFFNYNHFERWTKLCSELSEIEGVENLLSVSNCYNLIKNKNERKFEIKQVFPGQISNQEELDSLVSIFKALPFYKKDII